MHGGAADEDGCWDAVRHAWVVELGESERRLAQLAVLFLCMRQPLHQALLVDVLDAATAFARVEERFIGCALASTYPARVGLVFIDVVYLDGVLGGANLGGGPVWCRGVHFVQPPCGRGVVVSHAWPGMCDSVELLCR